MRVLIGCETSGRVREAFRELGHVAYSCDLLPADDGSPFHFQGDLLALLRDGLRVWDLLIAHPPCTYLTVSAAWAFTDPPYHQKVKPGTLVGAERRAARAEALDFVRALMSAPVPRIAIENPVGAISKAIRPPDQIIQPYQFGDDASKRTCLWLRGLKPLPVRRADYVYPRMVCGCGYSWRDEIEDAHGCPNCNGSAGPARPRWANQTDSGQNRLSPAENRWKVRSETYPGIARAMAATWSNPSGWVHSYHGQAPLFQEAD